MTFKKVAAACVIAILVIGVGGWGIANFEETAVKYNYEITTEEAPERYDEAEAVKLSELSESEQALLKDAFEKADDFTEESSVNVEKENRVDTNIDFDVVEIDGVPVIISISEERSVGAPPKFAFSSMGVMFGMFVFLIGLKGACHKRWESGKSSDEKTISLTEL